MPLRRFLWMLMCAAGLSACTSRQIINPLGPPSAEMRTIIHERLDADHDLVKMGLVKLDWDYHQIQALNNGSVEVYCQPTRAVSDDFNYTVYRRKDGTRFFIVQSGGIAGITNVYSNLK